MLGVKKVAAEPLPWIAIGTLALGRVAILLFRHPDQSSYFLREYYSDLIIGGLFFLFPYAFFHIYGAYPLSVLFNLLSRGASMDESEISPGNFEKPNAIKSHDFGPLITLKRQALRLEQVARSVYSRAGIYLVVGVLIAFAGLGFFSVSFSHGVFSLPTSVLTTKIIISITGLTFVELIAFFFLRQYRSGMDEYRYYENMVRSRHDLIVLLGLLADNERKYDPLDLVKLRALCVQQGILNSGETTEILESKKLQKDELQALNSILEVILKK
ncbi:hypothetical protein DWG20_15250 [Crenobacter cavernae]|uniref:Uncharacterized protein n=2 Tax=Crenobacter cavernae TaxID=2290923 RepID=A0A345Y9R6_9NEIS|nr:hypothetical protein DWG20_15250 [Crenobacter cavernae]